MEGIDEHIRQVGYWETCDTHYRYHINEKFTPHSQLTRANENRIFGPDMPSNLADPLFQPWKLTKRLTRRHHVQFVMFMYPIVQ
jgi:hypothetical protein